MDEGDGQLHTLSVLEQLREASKGLWGASSEAYFRVDELLRELISAARDRLRPGGMLALEIGIGQAANLASLLAEKNYHDIASIRDYCGVTRFLFGRYG